MESQDKLRARVQTSFDKQAFLALIGAKLEQVMLATMIMSHVK